MKYLFDEDEETEVDSRRGGLGRARKEESNDTEITLGMRSILGIFFGLVLICGVFFGLGYSVGRGSSAHPTAAIDGSAATDSALHAGSPIPKPSPSESGAAAAEPAAVPVDSDEQGGTATVPEDGVASTPAPATAPASESSAPAAQPSAMKATALAPAVAFSPKAVGATRAVTAPASAAPAAVVPVSAGAKTFMVQVAAVRLEEDADVLVSALKKHNYNAVVRREPQDQWLHVQIGPFETRAEANYTRSRLLADGYNAVVK